MGIQLSSEFYSDNGGSYDIEIYNESFGGTTKAVITNDLKITYESQGDDIMEALKASRCSFTLVNDSAEVDTFIANLVAGNEDQFKLVVKKQNNLEWCGVILIDQVSWEDMPKPRLLTITAVDGIGRLADIEFDFATTDTNPAQSTMLDYIFEALEYNDLSQYWGGTDAYFKESCEFYDTQIVTTGTSVSPLLKTRCDRYLFVTDEVIGEKDMIRSTAVGTRTITVPAYRPVMCSEVINSILTIFSCRMFMSGGSYHIQQVRNFSTSSYNQRSISKTLGILSYQTVSPRQTEGSQWQRLGDCRWTYLTPLRKVVLDSIPRVSVAQSGGGINELNTLTTPLVQEVDLGTLKGGSGSGNSMNLRLAFHVPYPANSLPSLLELKVEFKADNYRLYSPAQKTDYVVWTTTATDTVDRQFTYADLSNSEGIIYIDIPTPEFPFASKTACEVVATWTTRGTWSAATYIDIYPMILTLLKDNRISQDEQVQIINSRTQNSKIHKIPVPLLSDITAGITSKNSLEVNSTGTTWVFSDEWAAGYTDDTNLVKTMCLERMSYQDRAVTVLQGTIKVPESLVGGGTPQIPRFNEVYYYDSDTYYFNGGTLDCRTDEFSGEWIQFVQNKSGLTVEAEDGDGYVYRGDDKFGTPKKNSQGNDKWNRNGMFTLINKTLAVLDEDLDSSGGAITQFNITSLDRAIYENDEVILVHPENLRQMGDPFTISTDATSGDVTLFVTSQVPLEDIPTGALVMFTFRRLVDSEFFRTTHTGTPGTGGFLGDGALMVHTSDEKFYYQSNGKTFYVEGVEKT